MDRAKQLFITIAAILFVFAFSFEVKSAEPQTKQQSYEYTGIIKAKSLAAHVLTVQTQEGPIDFHYQRHGKKECAGLRELNVGDSIKVISSKNKAISEATCITKTRPVSVSK
ncbi:MAG: hypothetical protein NT010_11345 [Proteobacteria bacterium]|nr:hypothetical protein [Pseudomonadota bacterium]